MQLIKETKKAMTGRQLLHFCVKFMGTKKGSCWHEDDTLMAINYYSNNHRDRVDRLDQLRWIITVIFLALRAFF